jgi:hypothetical protein
LAHVPIGETVIVSPGYARVSVAGSRKKLKRL